MIKQYFEKKDIHFDKSNYTQLHLSELIELLFSIGLPLEELLKEFYEAGLDDAEFNAESEIKFQNRLSNFLQYGCV